MTEPMSRRGLLHIGSQTAAALGISTLAGHAGATRHSQKPRLQAMLSETKETRRPNRPIPGFSCSTDRTRSVSHGASLRLSC
jgi:hypothetical protein